MSDIYRRPLSRNFSRYEPWQQDPFNEHYSSVPPLVNIPNDSPNTYGKCECTVGAKVVSNCNGKDGYVGVCDGPYGNRCQCVNLKTGDSGCGNKKEGFGVWCS